MDRARLPPPARRAPARRARARCCSSARDGWRDDPPTQRLARPRRRARARGARRAPTAARARRRCPTRRKVELRLSAGRRDVAEPVGDPRRTRVAAIDKLLEYLPEEVVARLTFARRPARRAAPIVILRARTGRHAPPDLSLAAPRSTRRSRGMPDVYAPAGAIVEPPLRRERLRQILGVEPARGDVARARPRGDKFRVERIADAAFLPLASGPTTCIHASAPALLPWLRATDVRLRAVRVDRARVGERAPAAERRRGRRAPQAKRNAARMPARRPSCRRRPAPRSRRARRRRRADARRRGRRARVEPPGHDRRRARRARGRVHRARRAGRCARADRAARAPRRTATRASTAAATPACASRAPCGRRRGAEAQRGSTRGSPPTSPAPQPRSRARHGALARDAERSRRRAHASPRSPRAARPRSRSDPHRVTRWLDDHDGELDARTLWLVARSASRALVGRRSARARARARSDPRAARRRLARRARAAGVPAARRPQRRARQRERRAARRPRSKSSCSAIDEAPSASARRVEAPSRLHERVRRLPARVRVRAHRPAPSARARSSRTATQARSRRSPPIRCTRISSRRSARASIRRSPACRRRRRSPDELGAQLAASIASMRYKVDRLREASRILEPLERPDAIGAWIEKEKDSRGPEFAALREITDPVKRAKAVDKLVDAARRRTTPSASARSTACSTCCSSCPRSGAVPILRRVTWPLIAPPSPSRAARCCTPRRSSSPATSAAPSSCRELLDALAYAMRVVPGAELERVLQPACARCAASACAPRSRSCSPRPSTA